MSHTYIGKSLNKYCLGILSHREKKIKMILIDMTILFFLYFLDLYVCPNKIDL
jgi:hypothetical protein